MKTVKPGQTFLIQIDLTCVHFNVLIFLLLCLLKNVLCLFTFWGEAPSDSRLFCGFIQILNVRNENIVRTNYNNKLIFAHLEYFRANTFSSGNLLFIFFCRTFTQIIKKLFGNSGVVGRPAQVTIMIIFYIHSTYNPEI